MHIAILTLTFSLLECSSLKEKRQRTVDARMMNVERESLFRLGFILRSSLSL